MDKNTNNNIIKIFTKNINAKSKLVPFNSYINKVGEFKYFPAAFKEWRNDVYYFNNNIVTNFPVYNLNIFKIIKSYFSLFFKQKFANKKYVSLKKKRISTNKIYVSKPELSHTNHKVLITIYVYNREILIFQNIWKNQIFKLFKNFFFKLYKIYITLERIPWMTKSNKKKWILNKIKIIKLKIKKKLNKNKKKNTINVGHMYRKYKLYFDLNKYRFKDIFLYKLGKIISKFFNKKIEFNIIKLRSIIFHTDIFTEYLSLKLKRKKIRHIRTMNYILNIIKLSKESKINDRSTKTINYNLLENKYKTLNINYFINKRNLSEDLKIFNKNFLEKDFLKEKNYDFSSYKTYINFIIKKVEYYYNNVLLNEKKLKKKIFNKIKYKILKGIRLEIKGRLTKRYRAERSLHKVRLKGGLINIDSSVRGLSTVRFRGYINSNVEYSINTSKRRIGAFAVKGWISGGK